MLTINSITPKIENACIVAESNTTNTFGNIGSLKPALYVTLHT